MSIAELLPIVNTTTNSVHPLYKQLREVNWVTVAVLLDQVPCRTHTSAMYKKKANEGKKRQKKEEKEQKEQKEHQIWRISEQIPNATGLLWIDPTDDLKLVPGTVIAILNPTIMRRKTNQQEFDTPIQRGNGLAPPTTTATEDTRQFPVGLYVRSEHSSTSVCVLGQSTHFGCCKHVLTERSEDEDLMKTLGKKVKSRKIETCTQPIHT
jgi:hypothetical protein